MPKDRIPFSRKSFPQKSSLIPLHNRIHNFTTSLSFFTNYFSLSLEINLERKGRRKKQKEKEENVLHTTHSIKGILAEEFFPPLLSSRRGSRPPPFTRHDRSAANNSWQPFEMVNPPPRKQLALRHPSTGWKSWKTLFCVTYIYIYVYVFERALSFSQQQQHNNNNFPSLVIFTRRKILRD